MPVRVVTSKGFSTTVVEGRGTELREGGMVLYAGILMNPGDLLEVDFDMPTPLILFDQVYQGQARKALAAHSKQGWVYILDRVTGKPLLPVEEKPVPQERRQKTVATQPIPAGDPTAPQCAWVSAAQP